MLSNSKKNILKKGEVFMTGKKPVSHNARPRIIGRVVLIHVVVFVWVDCCSRVGIVNVEYPSLCKELFICTLLVGRTLRNHCENTIRL
ncbi:hypothetical protein CEXT_339741 [Caerostris extrusa]|uniref:Uncharacterized protein n=1 Tax=Caerostris extrusa TaxID=172846 RepID=A0AAV4XGA7_CAEEX|nr:hypothetical protein CEXT_339741 [Caerostris extrusa]